MYMPNFAKYFIFLMNLQNFYAILPPISAF